MDTHLISFLILVGCVIAFLYIVGPIVIWSTQRMSGTMPFQRFSLDQVPPNIRPYFDRSIQAFQGNGFVIIDCLVAPGAMTNVTPSMIYFINPITKDRANLTCIFSTVNGVSELKKSYIEFCTIFSNGDEIDTNNSSTVGVFKYGPEKRVYRFQDVQDVNLLFQLHLFIIEKYARSQDKVLPPSGEEVATLTQSITKDFEAQVKTGLLFYDTQSEKYRTTWYGAFYMTWSQLWPMKQTKAAQYAKMAQSILNEMMRSGRVTGAR